MPSAPPQHQQQQQQQQQHQLHQQQPKRIVHRSESLRSERSDASARNKHVSFNAAVDVKHIPRGAVVDRHGRLLGYLPPGDHRRLVYGVYKEPTSLSQQQLAREAERIIQQVGQHSNGSWKWISQWAAFRLRRKGLGRGRIA